ncbi:MAG: peptide ABC transporter substrate-binding protein [Herpetosiphonaceae bacterium]|nr:peptide ABC transporter substrate-binding protein [Herpetosiphonaceae bacterium]
MAHRLHWQIVLALAGTLLICGLVGSVALTNAARSLPLTGSVYVEGVVGVASQLNPLLATPGAPQSERDLQALLFDGLTQSGPDGTPTPALAERWLISSDSTVYTFTLRSGLRWHDAVPLTSDDVVWTIQSIQRPDFPGDKALADLWRSVVVTPLDSRRVQFALRVPFAPFLAATAVPILPAHLLQTIPPARWTADPFSHAPIGSGPFRLERLDSSQAVLRPFEGAVRGRPSIDLLILRFFPNTASAQAALQRHDVQGVAMTATIGEQPAVRGPTLRTTTAALDEYTILTFNVGEGLLHAIEVRRALTQSLDRDAIISQMLGGVAQRLDTPILPNSWAASDARLPAYDPPAAIQQLRSAGWQRQADGAWRQDKDQLELPLVVANTPPQIALANEVARQWRQIGIGISVEAVAPAVLAQHLAQHNFTIALNDWSEVSDDPDPYALWHSSQIDNGANYAGLADDKLDQLLVAGRTTTDQTKRKQIYADVQRRWTELVPSLPLFQPHLVFIHDVLIVPSGVEGTLLDGSADRFRMISDWSVTSQ